MNIFSLYENNADTYMYVCVSYDEYNEAFFLFFFPQANYPAVIYILSLGLWKYGQYIYNIVLARVCVIYFMCLLS